MFYKNGNHNLSNTQQSTINQKQSNYNKLEWDCKYSTIIYSLILEYSTTL